MSNRKAKGEFWSSRTISVISAFSFLGVLLIILLSNRYMNICVANEATAQHNRLELKSLGEALADGSDYLTDEARKYAITGDIQHFYNYWYDVEAARTRDNVINSLTSCNPPSNERELLEEAKRYSDILIETETYSMKMVLLSQNHTAEYYSDDIQLYSFIKHVLNYPLPSEYDGLSNDEMAKKSIEILYDNSYSNYKTLIMTPIEKFQNAMNTRLDNEATASTEGRKTASAIQVVCSCAVLMLIGALLVVMHISYVRPLNEYTAALNAANNRENDENFDITKARVVPNGSYELKNFGRLFNRLAFGLGNELENRKRAEAEMRQAKEDADKANSAKSDFLARMSHELRTPLNAIIGYLYLIKQSKLEPKQQRYCEKISYSSESLLGLISDILDFSKIESGNMTFENVDFSLVDLISEIYAVMENSIKQKGLRFCLDVDGNLPEAVKGDLLKLRQVLINLLGNALKFTADGKISFSVALVGSDDNGSNVRFSVSDTGIGVKEEDREKILEPFVQSDAGVTRKYGGTGLGLAICSMIVSEYSGGAEKLEFNSEYGKGSEFYFTMHFDVGDPNVLESRKIDTVPQKIDGEKCVLIVDDNDINLSMESEILKSFGVKAETAQSGAEAIEMTSAKVYDMILMDIRMPEMDGYESASRIRHNTAYRFVPIIALSADAVAGVYDTVIHAGMNDYATKPLRPEKLCALMQKYFKIALEMPAALETDESRLFAVNECLNNLGGRKKLLVKLVKRFLSSQSNSATYIESHIRSSNFGNASRILHDIIGLSGNLCCHILYDRAFKLKSELKEGKSDSLGDFMEAWKETTAELNEFAVSNEYLLEDDNSTEQSYDEIQKKLVSLCSQFDISASEYFFANSVAFKLNMGKPLFDKVKEAIEMYDFGAAEKLISDRRVENVQNTAC